MCFDFDEYKSFQLFVRKCAHIFSIHIIHTLKMNCQVLCTEIPLYLYQYSSSNPSLLTGCLVYTLLEPKPKDDSKPGAEVDKHASKNVTTPTSPSGREGTPTSPSGRGGFGRGKDGPPRGRGRGGRGDRRERPSANGPGHGRGEKKEKKERKPQEMKKYEEPNSPVSIEDTIHTIVASAHDQRAYKTEIGEP